MVAFYHSSRKVARSTEGKNTIHAGNISIESTWTVYSKGIITPGRKIVSIWIWQTPSVQIWRLDEYVCVWAWLQSGPMVNETECRSFFVIGIKYTEENGLGRADMFSYIKYTSWWLRGSLHQAITNLKIKKNANSLPCLWGRIWKTVSFSL